MGIGVTITQTTSMLAVSAVPEPTVLALWLPGLAGLMVAARQRAAAASGQLEG